MWSYKFKAITRTPTLGFVGFPGFPALFTLSLQFSKTSLTLQIKALKHTKI
jgi:hypothetical protein